MKKGLSDLPGIRVVEPEGAFYIFADITGTGMSDTEFADPVLWRQGSSLFLPH